MAETKKSQNLSITNMADMLVLAEDIKKFIEENKLSTNVQGKNFPQAEAWQYAGNRLNILSKAGYIKNLSDTAEIKYEASIILIDASNNYQEIGQGFAVCSNKEQGKKYYQEYAIASMAQTRAIGKAYRILLSFVMRLAGYEPTPAEEMDYDTNKPVQTKTPKEQPHPVAEEQALEEEIKYATAKQKEEIIRLLNNPVITRQEKTKMLLNINKLDEERAKASIEKLKEVIKDREAEQDAAA